MTPLQFIGWQDVCVLFCRIIPCSAGSLLAALCGVILSWVQEFAFDIFKLAEVPVSLLLHLVKVPLNSSSTLQASSSSLTCKIYVTLLMGPSLPSSRSSIKKSNGIAPWHLRSSTTHRWQSYRLQIAVVEWSSQFCAHWNLVPISSVWLLESYGRHCWTYW